LKTSIKKRKASSAAAFRDTTGKIRHMPAGLIYCVFSCLCPAAVGEDCFLFLFTVFFFFLNEIFV